MILKIEIEGIVPNDEVPNAIHALLSNGDLVDGNLSRLDDDLYGWAYTDEMTVEDFKCRTILADDAIRLEEDRADTIFIHREDLRTLAEIHL